MGCKRRSLDPRWRFDRSGAALSKFRLSNS
jgi:hypothetical protein